MSFCCKIEMIKTFYKTSGTSSISFIIWLYSSLAKPYLAEITIALHKRSVK